MNSLVGLEMGALGVDLVTACKVTMVCSPLFQLRVVSPSETIRFSSLQDFILYLLYLRVELAGGSPGMEGDKEEEEEEQGENEEE